MHHGDIATTEDFYEDDEPLDDVLAAFDRGAKGVTAPPSGQNKTLPRFRSRTSRRLRPEALKKPTTMADSR